MSRWKVVMQTYPPEYGLFGARGKTWEVFTPDRTFAARFRTHAEALAYADRMARTREVVLPRQLNTRRPIGTTKKYWEVERHVGTPNVLIRRRREDGHICQQITVNRKDLGLLAPMLLTALAEQEVDA